MATRRTSKRRRTEKNDATEPVTTSTRTDAAPVVVFAHGAGAPSSSDWMIRWRDKLHNALQAVEVVTFDYPYISGGKKRAPPKAQKLVDYHLEVVKEASKKYPDHPVILAGKSMGSRVSCMVAALEDSGVSAVVCLGYPLKATNGKIRDETLLQLKTPTMFVQGSKDGLCPLEKLKAVCKKMDCLNKIHIIEAGDHSFKISKKHLEMSGITQDEAEDQAAQAIAVFASQSL